eukprot:747843-Hanusia_phi.AAC.1
MDGEVNVKPVERISREGVRVKGKERVSGELMMHVTDRAMRQSAWRRFLLGARTRACACGPQHAQRADKRRRQQILSGSPTPTSSARLPNGSPTSQLHVH